MADRAAASANSTVSVTHRPGDAQDGPGRNDDLADIVNEVSLPADSREAIGTMSPARPPKRNRADRARPVASRLSLIVIRIVARLSLAAAHRIGTVAGLLYSIVPGRMREAGRANLRIAYPEMSDRELKRFARKCSVHAGRALLELPALWTWPGERVIELVREVKGRELLDDAIARGKGVVVATPHIGAWEMVVLWLGHSASLTAPFRELRLAELEDFIHNARQRTGTEMVPSQRFAARSLLRTLRDGGIIGMAPDQDAGSGSGVFVPLFHEVANTGVLIPRLVAKSGATMLWVFAERLEHGRGYRMHIETADPESGSADIVRGARAMNRDIESIVRRFPEQYLWFYRRYRRRPEGCSRNVYTKSAWRIGHSARAGISPDRNGPSPTKAAD
jgi:KDO2-lipid IV(A) lauroyltransferase